jgi:hypothetical protein
MSVDPLEAHNAGLSPEAAQAGRRAAPEGEGKPATDNARSREDRVELSDASRSPVEQAGETAGAPPQGTISAERLREVLDRLKTNFYDRPEVRDQIARDLAKDLGAQPTE